MTRILQYAALLGGLAVVCWIGGGHLGSPLALAVTLLIGVFYAVGAVELLRFQRATSTLVQAQRDLTAAPATLSGWLERIDASLRQAVRLRIEGERAALPGPALAPYLAGLLVLLGMLGTFVGMVVTLNGTGTALQGAADLQTIRDALSAPVRGLGLAFGTSVAGVAASAMLGLASALCRRERALAGRELDARIATTLRPFSLAHQREETFRLQQQQAAALPELLGQLQAMVASMERQQNGLTERLVTGQDNFHSGAEAAYSRLAESVDRSLQRSFTESARIAGATIAPLAEATMAGIAREAATLHETVARTVAEQLDTLARAFEATTGRAAAAWGDAVADQRRAHGEQAAALHGSLAAIAGTIEERSAALVDRVTLRLDGTADSLAAQFGIAAQSLETANTHIATTWREAIGEQRRANNDQAAELRQSLSAFSSSFDERSADLLDRVAARLDDTASSVATQWDTALAQQQAAALHLTTGAREALEGSAAAFARQSEALVQGVQQAHAQWRDGLAASDTQRLSAWTSSLQAMADALQHRWHEHGAHSAREQQQLRDELARTVREMTAQAEAHGSRTLAEIAGLLQAAAQAPRAAAETMAELRQHLTGSMVRDNAMLEERTRLLETLGTLLDAVNHAATDQRAAVDALLTGSADMLERVGERFTQQVDARTERLGEVAAQVTGGAVEVASLGEAFGEAVQLFSQSGETLVAQLARIEAALGKSMQRSDEQLAYYVAQAREVIDLSLMSQRQIVDDMQRLAANQSTSGVAA